MNQMICEICCSLLRETWISPQAFWVKCDFPHSLFYGNINLLIVISPSLLTSMWQQLNPSLDRKMCISSYHYERKFNLFIVLKWMPIEICYMNFFALNTSSSILLSLSSFPHHERFLRECFCRQPSRWSHFLCCTFILMCWFPGR